MGVMLPHVTVPSRKALADHLVRTRIAGDVATPRENNRSHYRRLAEGDRHYWFGLEFGERWTDEEAVLAVMAERCGVVADPGYLMGQDTIDPELTISALDRAARMLCKAVEGGQRVLFATGHPGGLLDVHRTLAAAVRAAGAEVVAIPGGCPPTRAASSSSATWPCWSAAPRCGTPTPPARWRRSSTR